MLIETYGSYSRHFEVKGHSVELNKRLFILWSIISYFRSMCFNCPLVESCHSIVERRNLVVLKGECLDEEGELTSFSNLWANFNRASKTLTDLLADEQAHAIAWGVVTQTIGILWAPKQVEDFLSVVYTHSKTLVHDIHCYKARLLIIKVLISGKLYNLQGHSYFTSTLKLNCVRQEIQDDLL